MNTGRLRRYIAKCEPAIVGQHGHNTTFKTACKLVWGFGLDPSEAFGFMLEYNARCQPPWNEYELRRKLDQALKHSGHRKPRGYLLGQHYTPVSSTNMTTPMPASAVWPKPDIERIATIVSEGPGLYDLWEKSPVRFDDEASHTEEIIDVLLPGNPLLCCAKSKHEFATRCREVWRGRLSELPFIVPNPMIAFSGKAQAGHESEHSKAATAKRVYQTIEFDFAERDKHGNDTIWAPLVRKWRATNVTIADACAALILYLAKSSPTLACVCHSGGKSLHAWFCVRGLERERQKAFMRLAVSLGADKTTWTKSQLVRIPDGLRENGVRQVCYYLDPKEAVTA